jgi:hypothetical protein
MSGLVRHKVLVPDEAWSKLEAIAAREGTSVNDLVKAAIKRTVADPEYGKRIQRTGCLNAATDSRSPARSGRFTW